MSTNEFYYGNTNFTVQQVSIPASPHLHNVPRLPQERGMRADAQADNFSMAGTRVILSQGVDVALYVGLVTLVRSLHIIMEAKLGAVDVAVAKSISS